MTWEYRFARTIVPPLKEGLEPIEQFHVIEVYYDAGAKIPSGYAMEIQPHGESRSELKEDLQRMIKAALKPVIDLDNFPKEL